MSNALIMFREVFRFEAKVLLRSPMFWLSSAVLFLLSFGAITTDAVIIGGAIGNVNRNAPFVIMQTLLVMGIIATFIVVAFVAGAVLRDQEHGTAGMLFSTPLSKGPYLFGRFAGALTASIGVMAAVTLAILVGAAMPWLEPERVGPFLPGSYLYSFFVLAVPNMFLSAAIFFSVATLTRSMMGTYVSLIVFLVGYTIAGVMAGDLENERLAVILDPFGTSAFGIATRYWTTAERNSQVLGLDGDFLLNRLLWLGVAVLILTFTYFRFTMTAEGRVSRRAKKRAARQARAAEGEGTGGAAAPAPTGSGLGTGALPTPSFGTQATWRQLLARARFEIGGVVRSLPFIIIVAMGVLNVVGGSFVIEQFAGTSVWPRTHLMIQVINSSFLLFVLIIVTFYSGELVWRDRQVEADGITDALPVPNQVFWGGKMAALAVILIAVLGVAALAMMVVQLVRGFTDIEPGLYALGVGFMVGWPFVLIAVLALTAQVLTNNKYAGFGLLVLYFLSGPILMALDKTHLIYQYASSPSSPYSDMNGYGHFIEPTLWFFAYWTAAAVALLVLTHLFWVRGRDTHPRVRLAIARRRLRPGVASVLVLALVAFAGLGGWIYYNTSVLNEYVSPDEQRERQAALEQTYGVYEDLPQPKITTVYAEVDLYPDRRAVDIRGRYGLVNSTGAPVDSIHVVIPPELDFADITIPGATPLLVDSVLSYRIYGLATPLAAGDSVTMTFEVGVRTRGFVNSGSNTDVVENGTFISSMGYFPHIGYQSALELQDPVERRRLGLPPVERMPAIDDPVGLGRTYISGEADWIDFETVVSTVPDQIALAPGYLEREWEENGRRYFHYTMDAPILPFWAYLSADWAVARDTWNDVEIAVYYHPDHPYNVQRMIEAVQKSLEYFTEEFGPYQHRQVRIVEFPRYASFAQSFPNTIPFSESIGFIARLTDEEAIDYVFYVTAHEVAHQWWAHQVIGANVQGATVLSETLSQYSALMVMEKEYGPEKMRRFLKYELDAYLGGRGGELIEELPLYLVENQPYVHYRKGSLAMYALRDHIGEGPLNEAIAGYLARTRFQTAPYTTTLELLEAIEAAVPEDRAYIIDDLFRTITLWDVAATEATKERLEDGRWRVRMTVDATKYRASGQGEEEEVAMEDLIDIGVFGAEAEGAPPEGEVLMLEKRQVGSGTSEIEVVVDREPMRVGIDPFNKLIDRNPENNITTVTDG